ALRGDRRREALVRGALHGPRLAGGDRRRAARRDHDPRAVRRREHGRDAGDEPAVGLVVGRRELDPPRRRGRARLDDRRRPAAGSSSLMAELHPGAKEYVDLVLDSPMVWEVSLEEARRGTDDETIAAWGELDEV